MRWLFRLLSAYYAGRAASRGPRALATFALRRQIRRGVNRRLWRYLR